MKRSRDLEDPRPYSEATPSESSLARQRNLRIGFLTFAALYASLHRLWLPLALRATELAQTPYAQIDFLFVPSLWIAYRLGRGARPQGGFAFWLGGGVGWALAELYFVATAPQKGWLALSHSISAMPLGLASAWIFSERLFSDDRRWLPFGIGLALASVLVLIHGWPAAPAETIVHAAPPTTEATPVSRVECGASVVASDGPAVTSDAISIEECGLKPTRLRLPRGARLRLRNSTANSLNLRLRFIGERCHVRAGWNLVVPPNREILSPALRWRTGEVASLHSDNRTDAGIVLLDPGLPLAEPRRLLREGLRCEWEAPR